jgi:hypothetical protein
LDLFSSGNRRSSDRLARLNVLAQAKNPPQRANTLQIAEKLRLTAWRGDEPQVCVMTKTTVSEKNALVPSGLLLS